MTPDMHTADYVFGTAGIVNQTGGWNTGIAFFLGLLSVQWTVRLHFPYFKCNLLRNSLVNGLLPCSIPLWLFLILNRITTRLLISRKATIIHAWIFFIFHWYIPYCAERKFVVQLMQVCLTRSTQLPPSDLMISSSFSHFYCWYVSSF